MRIIAILAMLVMVQWQSSELWAVYGSWSDPYTWLIWFTPYPILWRDEPCTYKVSRFFQRIKSGVSK